MFNFLIKIYFFCFFSCLLSCQTLLIKEGVTGKIVNNEGSLIKNALVWIEIYDSKANPTLLRLIPVYNGFYELPSLEGHSAKIYIFTEKNGSQHTIYEPKSEFEHTFENTLDYPEILFKTHLALLDRVSFWVQSNKSAITERVETQKLSNFLEKHFYELATQNKEHPHASEWLEVSSLYASWFARPDQILNFPLIRLKLQGFMEKTSK